ncbi:reverse transcriptase domain-containing protein [Tanacetum coccineum]
MCIDFKNLNSACPKDYYPLPNIDYKVESVMGFRYKCFLDAYKGYHQIQMAKKDEEKKRSTQTKRHTATLRCPLDLRTRGPRTKGWWNRCSNLEAYVDDMVIKSKDEKILLADTAETFDNLKKINMKLNPKKCSFGVEEGKFLGYMAEEAFQQMKKLILDLLSLTPPFPKETLYAYLAVGKEAMSAVLMTDRKGSQYSSSIRRRRYFEAHRVKVITDQPIKHILSNTEALGKLAKYVVEIGTYNIMFMPRNAVKGQVLADLLSEALEGENAELYFWMP